MCQCVGPILRSWQKHLTDSLCDHLLQEEALQVSSLLVFRQRWFHFGVKLIIHVSVIYTKLREASKMSAPMMSTVTYSRCSGPLQLSPFVLQSRIISDSSNTLHKWIRMWIWSLNRVRFISPSMYVGFPMKNPKAPKDTSLYIEICTGTLNLAGGAVHENTNVWSSWTRH